MVGGPAGFDQALTLRGDSEAVRRALRSAVALDGADVETTFEVTSLGGEQVWMRFYGDVRLELDLDALTQVELGVFSGFEGYGMGVVVESSSGQSPVYGIEAGHELILDPLRLVSAGVLERPLLVHGAHRSGELTGVALTYEPSSGALVLHQDI